MVYRCYDCSLMNLNDSCRYDRSQYYCSYFRKYYKPDSRACRHAIPRRYVTTAVCDVLNLEETDEYLSVFDEVCSNYMESNEEYEKLLNIYDVVGPIISECIYSSDDSERVAKIALETGIKPAYDLVKEGKNDSAIEVYCDMIKDLREFYGINLTYDEEMGRQRKRSY